ncbi:MAG TPA: glucosamine-6-phosphate deaminase [Bacteroidales bacterium]|nr:glucosamine-6-phosphate deaminase [Bacteroidales bacterium]HQG36643.1 glucosamine-6-phosphate deaminase [Bacteroidales bacterium]HQG52776.1 glucosamine-6-phosphate deaminase [Bacteroidales bacterium]HQJ20772.1 glucosamine-6-phosphate deaminase [Bacteroidales bacterium]
MEIIISETKQELGKKAAHHGAELIREAIQEKGEANIILATGVSQFEMLSELVREDIDWSAVTAFHLDEYIGISENHPASFRKYLKERFADLVPLKAFHYVNGSSNNPHEECIRLGKLIAEHPIDVAFIGIGENGHLAFNDPPADFETEEAYIVVNLNEECRKQQVGEGWFKTLEDVPKQAISMSIKQIMKSKAIICSVPDKRKARAVYMTINHEISPDCPASILRKHPRAFLYLDRDSASLI